MKIENDVKITILNEVIEEVNKVMPLHDDQWLMKNVIIDVIQSLLPKEEAIDWSKASETDKIIEAENYVGKYVDYRSEKVRLIHSITVSIIGDVWMRTTNEYFMFKAYDSKTNQWAIIDEPKKSEPLTENPTKGNIKPQSSNEKQCPPPPPPIIALKEGDNVNVNKESEPTKSNDRYDMCSDQLAQIDCRNSDCLFYESGNCNNISPAITLNPDKTFVCWSKKEVKTTEDIKKQIAKEILNKWGLLGSEGNGNLDIVCAVLEAVGLNQNIKQ